jgi:hypothetical protein
MERGDRGQLFVLAALALAVMIVGIALLLNSGVYGANLAAQNAETGVDEPREFLREAEIGANRVMSHSNYNNFTNYDTLRRNFTVGVHNWSERAHRHKALGGTGVEVSEVNVTNGSRITQDTDSRQFINESRTAANWTLGTNLRGVRQFRMNVSYDSLENETGLVNADDYNTSDYFRVNVTSGGSNHTVFIYRNEIPTTPDRVLLRVVDPSGDLSEPCSARANANGRATLYLTDGLIGRDHCEQLTFLQDPQTPFAINYTNGDAIRGSYELFVNEKTGNIEDSDFGTDPNSDPPAIENALYGATLDVEYTAEDTLLSGNRTAIPDRRRFISGGEAFSFSIPVGDNVTFKSGGSQLTVLNKQGDSSTYNFGGGGIAAFGPTAVDVNGGSELDTPITQNSGNLAVFPGAPATLASNAKANPDSTLGVGSLNGGGPSVFYPVKASGGATDPIHQVNDTGPSELVFTPSNDAVAVAGIANVTPDDPDLVYANSNQDVLYRDNGSSSVIIESSNIDWNDPPPVGTPADFDGDGTARVPFINSSGDLALASADAPATTIPTTGATPLNRPMATLDWDDDGNLDIIFINDGPSDELKVVYNVTGTNTVRPVNDSSGNPISVSDTTLGVR